jgi:serine/threonine protein phosphatase PrpC
MGLNQSNCTSEKENMFINYGVYTSRGGREEMEDYTKVLLDYGSHFRQIQDMSVMSPDSIDKEYPSYFSVLDGNSGILCAEYVVNQLPKFIRENQNYPKQLSYAIREAFFDLDKQFLRDLAIPEKLKDGTTATIAVIWENKIHIGHVGDCKAVVYHNNKSKVLTTDHTPTIESEKERIINKGGKIKGSRINGYLAISRCFGALPYKNKESLGERWVSVEPEIVEFNITVQTDFLILASDGIWDKLSVDEVTQVK